MYATTHAPLDPLFNVANDVLESVFGLRKNSGSRFGGPSKLVANFEKGGAGGHPQEDRSPVCMLTIHVGFNQRPTFFFFADTGPIFSRRLCLEGHAR